MRIAHSSDWHLGKALFEHSLLEDQQFCLNAFVADLVDQKIDLLLLAGDLYDRSIPPAQAVSLLNWLLDELVRKHHIKVAMIAGNHDSAQRLSFANKLYEQSGLYVCGGYDGEVYKVSLSDEFGPVDVYLLPHLTPATVRPFFPEEEIKSFDDAYAAVLGKNELQQNEAVRNILVAHGFFSRFTDHCKTHQAVLSESEVTVGTDDLVNAVHLEGYDYVALGHLHAPQQVGSPFIRYSGSPLKYSVSEATQQKSYCMIDLQEKGNCEVMTRPYTVLRDLKVLSGEMEALLTGFADSREDYVFANIISEGLILHAMDKLRTVYPYILGLRMVSKTQQPLLLQLQKTAQKSVSELFFQFYEAINGEAPDEIRKRVIEDVCNQVMEQQGGQTK